MAEIKIKVCNLQAQIFSPNKTYFVFNGFCSLYFLLQDNMLLWLPGYTGID